MFKTFVLTFDVDSDYSQGLFVHVADEPAKRKCNSRHFFVKKDTEKWIKLKVAECFINAMPSEQCYLNVNVYMHDDSQFEFSAPGVGPFQASYKVNYMSNGCAIFTYDPEYCATRGPSLKRAALLGEKFVVLCEVEPETETSNWFSKKIITTEQLKIL